MSERSLLVINHGLRDRLPYRCGVVRHVRLSCSWGCSAVDVEHATSDHFLQPKGKLNAHHVVLFLFLLSLRVKSSTTMPFFHVSLSLVRHLPQTMVRVARIPMRLPQQPTHLYVPSNKVEKERRHVGGKKKKQIKYYKDEQD